jgi:hypothetical protein
MAGAGREKTGILGARVAHSVQKIRNASRDATASLTVGKTKKARGTSMLQEHPRKRADSPRAKMDKPHDLNTKEAGSAMRTTVTATATITRAPKLTKTNHPCATENGARTKPDTALSAPSGTAVPNLKQNLNGWMPMTEMSHDEHIPRRILSAGRSV